ncbi:MAG TPA: type II secretion system protein [Candidatus Polarisedimenticolia bacterium]|nr:type II secretion system protein [Candidatus Polarisedimenticolia bacterium]
MLPRGRTASRDPESGHLLVALMVLIAVMLILLTVTGQSWVFIVRRDAEAELIFRGEEYARAIEFYKKELGSYPLELKTLMQPGPHRHRFIRRLYKDPLADDGKWGSLYLSPTGKGFINPYASRLEPGLDPLGGDGLEPSSGFGSRRDGLGLRNEFSALEAAEGGPEESAPGYSELSPEEFQARGGEQAGMPIVGVVHKHKESGLKIYKNQASLNDWAFTLLLQGQETQPGGAAGVLPVQAPPMGAIGDLSYPIQRGKASGKSYSTNAAERHLQQRAEQEQRAYEEKIRKEKEQARRRAAGEVTADDDAQEEEPPPEEEPHPQDEEDEGGSDEEEDDGSGGDDEEGEDEDPNRFLRS